MKNALREALAAAAPHDIPEWFKPVLPPLPPLPKAPKLKTKRKHSQCDVKVSTIIEASMMRFLYKLDHNEDPGHLDVDYVTLQTQFGMTNTEIDDIYGPFYELVKPYREAMTAREANSEKARMGQWPWAYADLVLHYR